MSKLLTTKEVADHLRVSPRTVQRFAKNPPVGFPRPVKIGARVRYHAADLEQYLQTLKGE